MIYDHKVTRHLHADMHARMLLRECFIAFLEGLFFSPT